MARRDERAYPQAGAVRGHQGARRPDGLLPENPPGGGTFVRGRRWLVPYSPLRGCSELAALATAKIPRRSTPRSFQTGSKGQAEGKAQIRQLVRGLDGLEHVRQRLLKDQPPAGAFDAAERRAGIGGIDTGLEKLTPV